MRYENFGPETTQYGFFTRSTFGFDGLAFELNLLDYEIQVQDQRGTSASIFGPPKEFLDTTTTSGMMSGPGVRTFYPTDTNGDRAWWSPLAGIGKDWNFFVRGLSSGVSGIRFTLHVKNDSTSTYSSVPAPFGWEFYMRTTFSTLAAPSTGGDPFPAHGMVAILPKVRKTNPPLWYPYSSTEQKNSRIFYCPWVLANMALATGDTLVAGPDGNSDPAEPVSCMTYFVMPIPAGAEEVAWTFYEPGSDEEFVLKVPELSIDETNTVYSWDPELKISFDITVYYNIPVEWEFPCDYPDLNWDKMVTDKVLLAYLGGGGGAAA